MCAMCATECDRIVAAIVILYVYCACFFFPRQIGTFPAGNVPLCAQALEMMPAGRRLRRDSVQQDQK